MGQPEEAKDGDDKISARQPSGDVFAISELGDGKLRRPRDRLLEALALSAPSNRRLVVRLTRRRKRGCRTEHLLEAEGKLGRDRRGPLHDLVQVLQRDAESARQLRRDMSRSRRTSAIVSPGGVA